MLPCHSLYIYGTWRSKYTESLKSMRKLKRGSGSQNVKGAIYIYIYIYISDNNIYITDKIPLNVRVRKLRV